CVHPRGLPVRALPLHGRAAVPGALPLECACLGSGVVRILGVRVLLPGPPHARARPRPARRARERRAHDAARRGDRPPGGPRRPVVPRAGLLLSGGGRAVRGAVVELRGLGPGGVARDRGLPRRGRGWGGALGPGRGGPRRRRPRVQPGPGVVDRRARLARARRPLPPFSPPGRVVPAMLAGASAGWRLSGAPGRPSNKPNRGDRSAMSVPAAQMWAVASYVLRQKLRGRRRYPLVLMLEPLFRCNLACAGCGKIQYPAQILRKQLSVEQCLRAVEECGAPIVSIPGGEPLMYPEIGRLVEELVRRGKYVYLCTNAIQLREKLEAGLFTPSRHLSFSVHLAGPRAEHDESVCRERVDDRAVDGIPDALRRGS